MNLSFLEQFSETWNLFFLKRFPFPFSGEQETDDEAETPVPELARILTPLVGAAAGLSIFIPAWVLSHFSSWMAAIVIGLLAPLYLEYLSGWNGLNLLVAYINARRTGGTQAEALQTEPRSMDDPASPAEMIPLISIYLLRVAAFGILTAVGSPFWIIAALTGAYAVRADLAGHSQPDSGDPLLPVSSERMIHAHWLLAAGIMISVSLSGFRYIPVSLSGLALAYGISWYAGKLCSDSISGVNENAVEIFGYAAEILLLLWGVLLLA